MSTDLVPLLDEEQSDHALVSAHRSGADEAFDALCLRYHDRLVDLLIRRTRDRGLAEDLTQETLLRAYQALDSFEAGLPLWPWLRTIAVNLATDHGRSPVARAVPTEDEPLIVAADDANPLDDPSEQLAERELLTAALSALNPRQRAAVGLRYLDGWSVTEVGRVLGMDPNAVAQLLMRARRRLSNEYRKLTRDGVYGLAWPLLLPLYRLRDRLVRLRDTATHVAPGPALASAEAAFTTAAVGALTTAIAIGSFLSPSPSLTEATSQSPDRAAPAVTSQPSTAAGRLPAGATANGMVDQQPPPMREPVPISLAPSAPTSATAQPINAHAEISNEGGERTLILYEYEAVAPMEGVPGGPNEGWLELHCKGPVRGRMCDTADQVP